MILSWGGRPYKKPRLDAFDQYTNAVSGQIAKDLDSKDASLSSFSVSKQNIAKVFKAAPGQKPISMDSFIIETPDVHYSVEPSQKSISSKQPSPTIEEKPIKHIDSDCLQGDISKQNNIFGNDALSFLDNINTTHHDEFPLDLHSVNELEHLDHITQPPAHSQHTSEHPNDEPNDMFLSIDDASNSLDLSNIDGFRLDDFDQDIAAFQNNELQYTTLFSIPFRDESHSSLNSESSSSPASEVNSESTTTVTIPRSLEPLPDLLLAVPMYKDLFYHFVYITADFLVPAPSIYPQNPFKTILPSMALSTPHLLSLLLAFSASHTVRYLRIPISEEVVTRLLNRTFQGFIKCLENEKEAKSDTTLTTAILLSSYDILTSTIQGHWKNGWKTHMHGARDIVIARNLAQSLLEEHSGFLSYKFNTRPSPASVEELDASSPYSPKTIPPESTLIGPRPLGVLKSDIDESNVSYFLIRWFAYIDVIGSLSSPTGSAFLTANEDMAQLWGLHDWHLARMKERSLKEINESSHLDNNPGYSPVEPSSNGKKNVFSMSNVVSELATNSDVFHFDLDNTECDFSDISARHYGIKVDFMLGVDLDVLPVFSKISALVRQRRRLSKSWELFMKARPKDSIESSQWIQNWTETEKQLNSEALELSEILFSFCQAYELRRKQYLNSAFGILEKKRRDSSSSSNSSSSGSPTMLDEQNAPSVGSFFTSLYGNTTNNNEPSVTSPPFTSSPGSTLDEMESNAILERKQGDGLVFPKEAIEKLNAQLMQSEVFAPALSQLPQNIQLCSQLCVMNTEFCYAAIIQIYRRVLKIPSHSDLVQSVVRKNVELLTKFIPCGSPIESCMSFPVFTTGCELLESDSETRRQYWLRLKGMERFGVDQVSRAKILMELCWKEKRDWPDIMEERGMEFALA